MNGTLSTSFSNLIGCKIRGHIVSNERGERSTAQNIYMNGDVVQTKVITYKK